MKVLKYIEPFELIKLKEDLKRGYSLKTEYSDGEIQRVIRKFKDDEKLFPEDICILLSVHDVLQSGSEKKIFRLLNSEKYKEVKAHFSSKVLSNWSRDVDLELVFMNQNEFDVDLFDLIDDRAFVEYIQSLSSHEEMIYFIDKVLAGLLDDPGIKNLFRFIIRNDANHVFKISAGVHLLKHLNNSSLEQAVVLEIFENLAESIVNSSLDYSSHLFSLDKTAGYIISLVEGSGLPVQPIKYPYLYELIKEKDKILSSMKSLDDSAPDRYEYWSKKISKANSVEVKKWYNKVAVAMEFGAWVLVEQGPTGHALYCYTKSSFERIRSEDNWIVPMLTYRGFLDILSDRGTLVHNKGWQQKADELLDRILANID